jgi:hypothetical protein
MSQLVSRAPDGERISGDSGGLTTLASDLNLKPNIRGREYGAGA